MIGEAPQGRDESPVRQTVARQRENHSRNPRKAAIGVHLRAGLSAPNRLGVSFHESVMYRLRIRTAIESTRPQDRSGKLPLRLLADSKWINCHATAF